MNRMFLSAMLVLGLALTSLSMTACNMMEGVGKDTQETGTFIGGTPPHEAYHQEARDF